MSSLLKKYLMELQSELDQLNINEKKAQEDERLRLERESLENKIDKLKKLIDRKGSKYLVRNKEGYLSVNDSFTTNKEFAYVFDEDEAIKKARSLIAWIEAY